MDDETADVPKGPAPAPEDELPTVRLSTSLIEEIERANAWLSAPESDTTSSGDESMPTLDLPTAEMAAGSTVLFTFFWRQAHRWEGTDFKVEVAKGDASK